MYQRNPHNYAFFNMQMYIFYFVIFEEGGDINK